LNFAPLINAAMKLRQLNFGFMEPKPLRRSPGLECVELPGARVPLRFRRNRRARRYILRLDRDGAVLVTVPGGGNLRDARSFAHSRRDWILEQREHYDQRDRARRQEAARRLVWFRGRRERVAAGWENSEPVWRMGDWMIPRTYAGVTPENFREMVEADLRAVAAEELRERTRELAEKNGISIKRVTVRSQHSRWGSCSATGTISLNWRLIQTPAHVRDYIILHELVHRREMNHSRRFWREVERVCPTWKRAEAWLKKHGNELID